MIEFLLTGNGPVTNRGCEAIVLGTRRILQSEFGPVEFTLASFAHDDPAALPDDTHPLELAHERRRFTLPWWQYQLGRALGQPEDKTGFLRPLIGKLDHRRTSFIGELGTMSEAWRSHHGERRTMNEFAAAFSVGGDGYSIDFGHFVIDRLKAMDACLKSRGIPVIVWGASIGPFDREPEFERTMAQHLAGLDLVVTREPRSYEYLRTLGLAANLRLAPDPAFALPATPCPLPDEITRLLDQGCLGLNLSPLLARYVTRGNLAQWQECAAASVEALCRETGLPLLLIPHVTMDSRAPTMDDSVFLTGVLRHLTHRIPHSPVALLPPGFSSSELKWVISRTRTFIGARAHATMAALSSGVPTLSLAYSRKAWGINELVFGHHEWVLSPADLTPVNLSRKVCTVLEQDSGIRSGLQTVLPKLTTASYAIARELREIVRVPPSPIAPHPSPLTPHPSRLAPRPS